LVGSLAEAHPLSYVDIGSRGGFQYDLLPLAAAVDAVGFEPDPEAFAAIEDLPPQPWRSMVHLPFAVSDTGGPRTLYVPRDPTAASLLRHNTALGARFNKQHLFDIVREETVDTLDLKSAVAKSGLERVDYLKIDVEGAELSILQETPTIVQDLLCSKIEVAFLPPRVEQPLAFEIVEFMCRHGFELMDMIEPAHWRSRGALTDPWYSNSVPAYAKGQLIHSDFLFLRNSETLDGDIPALIRLALLQMTFGYFDHALEVLERPQVAAHLQDFFNCAPLEIIAPASSAYGRKRFVSSFYNQIRGIVPHIRYLKNLLR
jgi:FkbM family methyltransferase